MVRSRLSAVEADECQVSRPLRGLHDFIPTACVRNMRTWGGTWHVDLEERRPQTVWRGSGRSMTACWASPARQEGRTLQFLQQQPWAQHMHVERTRNRAVQNCRKWMGASRLERAEPHGCSPGQEKYFLARWTFRWGPTWDWERGHVRGGSTPGGRWADESERGPRDRSVLSPTGISPG